MGLKYNRLFLILGILFAICVNYVNSSYYCYYYYDLRGYWRKCTYYYYTYDHSDSSSGTSAGKIVGYVFAGLFGLAALLSCISYLCVKICEAGNQSRVVVRPAISHIDTVENVSQEEQSVMDIGPTPQYEATGHSNPI